MQFFKNDVEHVPPKHLACNQSSSRFESAPAIRRYDSESQKCAIFRIGGLAIRRFTIQIAIQKWYVFLVAVRMPILHIFVHIYASLATSATSPASQAPSPPPPTPAPGGGGVGGGSSTQFERNNEPRLFPPALPSHMQQFEKRIL